MSLERLNEALENASCWMAMDYGDQHNDADCDACVIDSAARAYRDLLTNGERVLWRAVFDDPKFEEADSHHFSWGSLYKVNPPTEEE